MDQSLLVGRDQDGVCAAQVVHRHCNVDVRKALQLRRLGPLPKLDLAVPSTCDDYGHVVHGQDQ